MAIGCISAHRAFISDRGGDRRLFELTEIAEIRWSRLRDDISESTLTISGESCRNQADQIAQIEPGRHELVVYRGSERVWEGPVNRLTYTSTTVEIHALDVMYYAARTVMEHGHSSAYPNTQTVVERAKGILDVEMERKQLADPSVNMTFTSIEFPDTDARTTAVTLPYQYTVQEHIDSLAARSGLDYTTVLRTVYLWDTHQEIGRTPIVTEGDFLGDIIVSVYGSELTTRAIVTDGEGNAGIAGGPDDYYGEWDSLVNAYDEESDATAPTLPELQSQAERSLVGRVPTPVVVRVPDNSSLNPNGVLKVSDLIPGVYIPLMARTTIRTLTQMQKLSEVTFHETPDGEEISVTLYPAAASDETGEGDD